MKNLFKTLSIVALFSVLAPTMSSCSSSLDTNSVLYLKVLNAGDYVYLNDPDAGYEEPDLVDQYTAWINEDENKEKYFGEGFTKRIEIIYDTYDTNETMYNELMTGKSTYDLICSSDYMLQKLAAKNMIKKVDKSRVSNYEDFASNFLIGDNGKLANVQINPADPSLGTLNDYSIGYMWGTLGLMYDPAFSRINGMEEDEVIDAFSAPNGWDVLWDYKDNLRSVASIKDSMRDTYAMGIAHAYSAEFAQLYEDYKGNYNDEYNKKLSEIFNRNDDESIQKVQDALIELKDYIYGFEVDTGKSDIVTGKVGINLCWSGDAVYSMDTAEENEVYLYYSIPSYCCNIWFDGFAIPERTTDTHIDAAYSFLDFISQPEIASENMDYVGYTPFIGGSDVFDIVSDWYQDDETTDPYAYDLYYFFNDGVETNSGQYVVTVDSEQINRQMRAQYPLEEDISHLAIMQDFGTSQNDKIVKMWERVKVNPLPPFVIVVVIAAFVLMIGFLGSYKLIKKLKVRKRRKLIEKD